MTRTGRAWPLLLLLCTVAPAAWAQSNGKVTGVVIDAATNDPLPGVSVYLEEDTRIGTITDAEGRYFLLNVTPGTYTVAMSFVGYATLKHAGVAVFSGRTTTVDGTLREEVLEGEEVVVTAARPIVVRDRTSSVSFLDQEAIDQLPVQEMADLVRFQPGVVAGSGGFHFRGGRTRETAYLVDGIPVQNVFDQGGGNTMDIEVASVQELQVFTGTFDAEMGGAQSGVVSVTTRDPGDRVEGTFRARTGAYLTGGDDRFLGGDTVDPAERQDYTLTLSGPIVPAAGLGFFVTARYEDREGHLKGIRRFTPEDGLVIDVYRRWYRDVYQPQDTRLIALDTARTPTGEAILREDGTPLTFAGGDGAVVDMSWNRSVTLHPKFVWRPGRQTHLAYSALYNYDEGQGYNHALRYAPDARSTSYTRDLTHIVTVVQTFGDDKFFNLRGSYKHGTSERYAFASMDDPQIQYLGGWDDVTGYSLGQTDNGAYASSERQWIAAGDFTWQVDDRNEFKTGFFFRNNRFEIEDLDRSWVYADDRDSLFTSLTYPPAAAYESFEDYLAAVRSRLPVLVPELPAYAVDDRFDQSPVEVALFAQDKLEFDNHIVLKAGLRFELFDVREDRIADPRTPTDRIGRADNLTPTPAKRYLSPRLGISFPISATGAFRVAYGHFVQMPAYRELFKNPVFDGINVGRLEGRAVGNPDLEPERTIKYEMGLQQGLTDFVGLDVSIFYKNVRNLLGTEVLTTLDNVLYTRTVNRDFGLVKGGTIALVTRPVGLLLGTSFDVTYTDAKGSASDPFDIASVVTAGRSGEAGDFFLERKVIPLNWDQLLTANLAAQIGRAGDWSVGFIGQLATGQPYTPAFLDPNLDFPSNAFDNAERKPLKLVFDVSAEKRFRAGPVAYGFRFQVNNLFNRLNELEVDAISGRAGEIVRLPVVQQDRDRVNEYVGLFTKAQDDAVPTWYSAPREVLVAVTVSF